MLRQKGRGSRRAAGGGRPVFSSAGAVSGHRIQKGPARPLRAARVLCARPEAGRTSGAGPAGAAAAVPEGDGARNGRLRRRRGHRCSADRLQCPACPGGAAGGLQRADAAFRPLRPLGYGHAHGGV